MGTLPSEELLTPTSTVEVDGLAGEDALLLGLVGGDTGLTLERALCSDDGDSEREASDAMELTDPLWLLAETMSFLPVSSAR